MALEISALDRYIPSRALINFESAYGKLMYHQETEPQGEINASSLCKSSKRLELVRQLDKIANINERILKITPSARASYVHPWMVRLWPCQPRKKPIIRDERLLDLPDFNCGFDLNPIDWGPNDCLATSVANKVLIGRNLDHPKVAKEKVIEYEGDRATAVCWSPNGLFLAFGSEMGVISVWNVPDKFVIEETLCCRQNCSITVIHWHPDSNVYAWGCSRGRLSITSVNQYLKLGMGKVHKGYICGLKYSPRGNYLCSSGKDAFLRIWKGPNYEPYMEIEIANPSRAIAWHPWRTGFLAVGEGPPAPASLSLWNVNTAELLFIKKLPPTATITALNFNQITGELVFAQSHKNENMIESYSDIIVLGGPHYVIDSVTNILGTVFSLIWNADCTKLGAGISNETLRIWNFLKPMKRKRPSGETCEDITTLAMKKFNGVIR